MGWLDGWSYRIPIACDASTPAATVNAAAPIPEDWDHFWNEIDSSGVEIRVTKADGITALAYQWEATTPAFSKTNKTGLLEIGAVDADASNSTVALVWLYYGNTGASSGASAPATTSQVNGYIHLGKPSRFIVAGKPVEQGLTQPERTMQKTAIEKVYVWFEVRRMLEHANRKSGGHFMWEEVQRVEPIIAIAAGTEQPTMIEVASTRFVEITSGAQRGFYIGMVAKAGTTATDYTLLPTVWTWAPEITVDTGALVGGAYRILEPRAYLTVRDVSVPA